MSSVLVTEMDIIFDFATVSGTRGGQHSVIGRECEPVVWQQSADKWGAGVADNVERPLFAGQRFEEGKGIVS